ncbi:hypothetical protein B0J12DRAFT_210115 [Macrophomina phaseolina]|uniref:C2H2-type domain-containing protein n=1 Tax=Macrophomina phaseolina TaxID=35725 RepID=A0ABQ8G4P2_9PEZI|nr:hypothetical protein B0J12DRAFT_210115 [Macrophomina phaseolina]
MTSSRNLPRLAEATMEEPFGPEVEDEEELECRRGLWYLCCVTEGCPHGDSSIGDDSDLKAPATRRRSGESPGNSIASHVGERFPSLTRRWDHRTVSILSREDTCISTASKGRASWSSPPAGSILRSSFNLSENQLFPSPARPSGEYKDGTTPTSPVDTATTIFEREPIDRAALASTPLLPPLMVDKRTSEETSRQSPLRSPPVVHSKTTFSAISSPLGTPEASFLKSPPLSLRLSLTSFRRGNPNRMVPSSDIPPMTINEDKKQDKWSTKLGHSNFKIYPEPCMPEVCDVAACREVFARWEEARCHYAKHQVRIAEHFGITSETYRVTEQKWAEIDAQWERCHETAVARAAEAGLDLAVNPTPREPPALMEVPLLEDPRTLGQFPALGDEDIVGPIVQIATRNVQPRSSKKAPWVKFNNIKFSKAISWACAPNRHAASR